MGRKKLTRTMVHTVHTKQTGMEGGEEGMRVGERGGGVLCQCLYEESRSQTPLPIKIIHIKIIQLFVKKNNLTMAESGGVKWQRYEMGGA